MLGGCRLKKVYSDYPRTGSFLLPVLSCIFIICSCSTGSVLSTKSILKIRMFGSLEAPVGAEGTSSPVSQTYLFKGVTLTKADGSGDVELYEDDAFTVRIVSRPQLIFQYDKLGDYVTDKVSFSAAKVKFDPQVVVATKETDDAVLTLDSGDFSLTEDLTPEDSTNYTLNLKVSWGKTVTTQEDGTEIIAAPSIALTYKSIGE